MVSLHMNGLEKYQLVVIHLAIMTFYQNVVALLTGRKNMNVNDQNMFCSTHKAMVNTASCTGFEGAFDEKFFRNHYQK